MMNEKDQKLMEFMAKTEVELIRLSNRVFALEKDKQDYLELLTNFLNKDEAHE